MYPLVSVIVPVYNVENTLNDCLESILQQTFSNYEIICVNDGSTDNSLDILQVYKNNYPNLFKIISQENKGLGGARNTGVNHSKGNYIFFIDSDDTILNTTLSILVNKSFEDDYDIISSGLRRIRNNLTISLIRRPMSFYGKESIIEFTKDYAFFSVWGKLYNAIWYKKNSLEFKEKVFHEDIEFSYKCYLLSNKTTYVDNYLYQWNINRFSISNNFNIKYLYDLDYTIRNIKNLLIEKCFFIQYYYYYLLLVYRLIKHFFYKIIKLTDEENKKNLLFELYQIMVKYQLNDIYNFHLVKNQNGKIFDNFLHQFINNVLIIK